MAVIYVCFCIRFLICRRETDAMILGVYLILLRSLQGHSNGLRVADLRPLQLRSYCRFVLSAQDRRYGWLGGLFDFVKKHIGSF